MATLNSAALCDVHKRRRFISPRIAIDIDVRFAIGLDVYKRSQPFAIDLDVYKRRHLTSQSFAVDLYVYAHN